MAEEEKKEEKKAEEEKGELKHEEKEVKEDTSEIAKLKQQISFLEAENEKNKAASEDWKNKYYMAYADMANLRKQMEKDRDTFIKYRASGFIEKILPALDSFDMAAKAKTDDPKVSKFLEGYKMIHTQLNEGLKAEGVSFIEPKAGEDFNANTMHAVQTADGEDDNKIVATYTKGYMLHDRLLRPAMVVVSKKKETRDEDQKKDDNK